MGGGGSKHNGNYLLETLGDHTDAINCVAISEDQSLLATGSEDKTCRMWSTKTDETECLGELRGHTDYVTCITICDTFVITGSADKTVRKWDMTSCECVFNFKGHTSRLSRVIATGDFIFSTSYDKTMRCWIFDAEDELDDDDPEEVKKACIRVFTGHTKGVYSVIFIPAEDQSDVGDKGSKINPGDILITGSADCDARCWSLDSGNTLRIFRGHQAPIMCMTTDPNGTILYTGSQDKDIRSWDISTGKCLKIMQGHTGPVICLTVVNRLMYSGSQDGKARCWVREFGDCTRVYKGHKHSIVAMKFQDGILYTASGDTCTRGFDSKSGTLKRIFMGHDSAVTCLTIVGEKLYTGSFDGTLRVWCLKRIKEDLDEYEEEEEEENEEPNKFETKQNQRLEDLDKRLDPYMEPEGIANEPQAIV